MIPGPNYIYKCPNCPNLLYRGSLVSGNTFGAKLYSDGKQEAPMLPEFPSITQCPKCKTIFWIDKVKEVGEMDVWDRNENPQWKDVKRAEFLPIQQYFTAIENKLYDSENEEIFIRLRIWWSFNDRVRKGKPLFKNEHEETQWLENVHGLLRLFDPADVSHRIMTAELYRNMGQFDKCKEVLSSISDSKFDWLTKKFISECDKGNNMVFELKNA